MSEESSKKQNRTITGDLFEGFPAERSPVPSSVENEKRDDPGPREKPSRMVQRPEQDPYPPSATPPGAGKEDETHIPVELGEEDLSGMTVPSPDSFLPLEPEAREEPAQLAPRPEPPRSESAPALSQPVALPDAEDPLKWPVVIGICAGVQLVTLAILALIWFLVPGMGTRGEGSEISDSATRPVVALPEIGAEQLRRLEILELEDRVMARQDRLAWQALQEQLEETDKAAPDHDALTASLKRINQVLSADEPVSEPLDPNLFPGVEEEDFPSAQLIGVLSSRRYPPAQRIRAAQILADRPPTSSIVETLVKAMEEDPNLHVVREAGTALKAGAGYPGDIMDPVAARTWVKEEGAAAFLDGPEPQ